MNDYIFSTDDMFFKHEISENTPCDMYSVHIHSSYELIYFLDGDATHVIEDRKYKLKKHDLVLIRPFQYHFIQIDSSSRYERYDVLFDGKRHNIDALKYVPEDMEIINIRDNSMARDVFQRCDIYRKSCSDEIFSEILPHLVSELFYAISVFPHAQPKQTGFLSPLISDALRYINDNLCVLKDVREVSDHLFISESYLFRLFKKELHQSPRQYITEKRLLLAKTMLSDGQKPTEVSLRCGFSDYTTFYRNYIARFGYSPVKTSDTV